MGGFDEHNRERFKALTAEFDALCAERMRLFLIAVTPGVTDVQRADYVDAVRAVNNQRAMMDSFMDKWVLDVYLGRDSG